MVGARARWASAVLFIGMAAAAVAAALVAPQASPAADALVETRTLFLTERFTPSGVPRGPLTGPVVPEGMVALKGEREGFQLAVNNTSGSGLSLAGRIVPDEALAAQQGAGAVDFELLRANFVNVPTASTRVDGRGAVPQSYQPGVYEDALPPLRNDTEAGRLSIPAGQWGGVAVIAKVRTDAAAGTYTGSVELYVPGGRGNEDTVYARQPFSVEVRNQTLLQNGQPGSFKTVMHVEGDAYWLQNAAMRRGINEKYPSDPDRMLQLQGLMSFLDSRGVSINEQPFGGPAASGAYTCQYSSHSRLPAYGFLDQTLQRYFAPARDIDPGARQFPTRMFPSETDGCDPSRPELGYNAKTDPYRTPGVKQDDLLAPGAGAFFNKIAATWAANGMFGGNAYVKNPFDEPSDVTAAMRTQYTQHVPKANTLLHAALKGRAKVVLADWPRDDTPRQVCRVAAGHKSCTTLSGDGFNNRFMWDGKGTDDVDVWLAPFSRLFGRPVGANLKPFKINRDREYADRLAKIKKLRGGREVWAYNFFTGNAQQPQLTIDAPATDARMNYWVLAREGHTGLFVSNTILGWGAENKTNDGGSKRKGNPYEGATYFKHGTYGLAAGWGNFLYPGYYPPLGLDSEADRNSASARPVTTLRMEGMRDGQEDANLMRMYRQRFGDAKVQSLTKPIFPGTYKQLPKQLGQVMFPVYDNGNNLALRLETQRREMISALG